MLPAQPGESGPGGGTVWIYGAVAVSTKVQSHSMFGESRGTQLADDEQDEQAQRSHGGFRARFDRQAVRKAG